MCFLWSFGRNRPTGKKKKEGVLVGNPIVKRGREERAEGVTRAQTKESLTAREGECWDKKEKGTLWAIRPT